MITVSDDEIREQHHEMLKVMKSGAAAPLFQSTYNRLAFGRVSKVAEAQQLKMINKFRKNQGLPPKETLYPYDVLIPPPMEEMLEGNFEPQRVITITEPFQGPWSPMWFGNSAEGINIRWGFINGDSRKLDKTAFDDSTIHGFLGGATGQGKSVTLNSLIYGVCEEYPPWEVCLSLSDAKIIEFKSIAKNSPMPHIDIVAATSDADYTISMLETKHAEMMNRNKMFTIAQQVFSEKYGRLVSVKKLADFREVTGLCLPRDLMIFDEVTAMFQNAGQKKSAKIAEIIDSFARLGRSAGLHFLLTSQEISSDLPSKTLANMSIRGAMGCEPEVSTKILGNTAAVLNKGQKGKLIVNTHSSDKASEKYNIDIRVPYAPDSDLNMLAKDIIQHGKDIGFRYPMQFYDEQEKSYADRYEEILKSFERREDRILLGLPSFIMHEPEQIVKFNLTCKDPENIVVLCNTNASRRRFLDMLTLNLEYTRANQNLVNCADMDLWSESLASSRLKYVKMYKETNYDGSKFFMNAKTQIYRRLLAKVGDEIIFEESPEFTKNGEIIWNEIIKDPAVNQTETNKMRAQVYYDVYKTNKQINEGFGIPVRETERVINVIRLTILTIQNYGLADKQCTAKSFPFVYFWCIGFDRILGLVRDNKYKFVGELKKMMQDCTGVNARFLIIAGSFDGCNDLVDTVGALLSDDLTYKQQNLFKCADDWPQALTEVLGAIYMKYCEGEKVQKFKKLMYKGE